MQNEAALLRGDTTGPILSSTFAIEVDAHAATALPHCEVLGEVNYCPLALLQCASISPRLTITPDMEAVLTMVPRLPLACLLCGLSAVPPVTAAEAPSFGRVLVPAGRYYVGGAFGKQNYRAHANVEVRAYLVMRTEVTYELYRAVAAWGEQHGYNLDDPCTDCDTVLDGGKLPVTNISWLGAAVWANALSEMQGLEPAYRNAHGAVLRDLTQRRAIETSKIASNSPGWRLPDMAEWQIAARGADKGLANGTYGAPHAGGWHPPHDTQTERNEHDAHPSPVARLRPNALGLYDMSGNAAEWTATPFDMGEGANGQHAYYFYCGESFAHGEGQTLASCDFHSSGFAEGDIGFRLVRWQGAQSAGQ